MNTHQLSFNEHEVLEKIRHYLPCQAPLKDFIHHNTLHAFQNESFFKALSKASGIFGFRVTLSLNEFRALYKKKTIREDVLDSILSNKKGKDANIWKEKLLHQKIDHYNSPRIGQLRANWKKHYNLDLDILEQPLLFRVLCSYLDQGISIWNFPVTQNGFLASVREIEKNSFTGFLSSKRAKHLLMDPKTSIEDLLYILVGSESLYEHYLFDQQFAHQGWSGMVSYIEDHPETLLDQKTISLHDLIIFELLLEIDELDKKFGTSWQALASSLKVNPTPLFDEIETNELHEILALWQESFEWSYYDLVLEGLVETQNEKETIAEKSFQALFCIDDRECSIRRYVEKFDPNCETFGTPGFFGVEFYYQPEGGKFHTKLCPAPMNPKYLIKEVERQTKRKTDAHFIKQSHNLFSGWLISQTLGFWSAFRLFVNVFRPSMSPATTSSFKHMDKFSKLTVQNFNPHYKEGGLQIGFSTEEMVDRVEGLLKSIGLVKDFAPIVYVVGHGASSANNTHYAGYDCGACSGRPGSVNARVICYMANHPRVRVLLASRGIEIPAQTHFFGALHDTTRDEIEFYDEASLPWLSIDKHLANQFVFKRALAYNAKERSRRFESINTKWKLKKINDKIKTRSVSLFEPRPELNHATNALCIVGDRNLTKHLFLDRRSFLNSYDYRIDPDGKHLLNILKALAPVCGGINLEYYFSRVDNQKLGAGSKLPHNIMGLIGVANGIDGDLRPGLPSQMIEVHDPLRLMIIVEQVPELILKVLQMSEVTHEWFLNEWIHLVAIHPESQKLFVYKNKMFEPYIPLKKNIEELVNINQLIESTKENIPVQLIH